VNTGVGVMTVRIQQSFDAPVITDIEGTVAGEIQALSLESRVQPGQTVAVSVGSRGIAHIGQIITAIKANNLNLTAGDLDMGRWNYTLRTVGEIKSPEQIRKIDVRANPLGGHIRVGDVATVHDAWAERETITRYNGEPSATLTVAKKTRGNSIQLIGAKGICMLLLIAYLPRLAFRETH